LNGSHLGDEACLWVSDIQLLSAQYKLATS
jgi:hypothetical protein